jgi:hypothetical protein
LEIFVSEAQPDISQVRQCLVNATKNQPPGKGGGYPRSLRNQIIDNIVAETLKKFIPIFISNGAGEDAQPSQLKFGFSPHVHG